MNIDFKKQENKIILKVTLKFKGKKGFSKTFTNADAINWIKENHPGVKLGKIISSPKKHLHNLNRLHGEWVFENCSIKVVDNLNNNVKINTTKIEAESPQGGEQKSEASLPNGLKKITKTRKKRATKKKTTEE